MAAAECVLDASRIHLGEEGGQVVPLKWQFEGTTVSLDSVKKRQLSFSEGFRQVLLRAIWSVVVAFSPAHTAAEGNFELSFAGPTDALGAPEPWKLNVWSGKDDFDMVCESGGQEVTSLGDLGCPEAEVVLRLRCDGCSYKLNYRHPFEARPGLSLEWEWKAVSLPSRGDVREKSTDDQGLQIYVYFSNGTALNYIWDSRAPVDSVVAREYGIPRILRIIFFFMNFPPDVDVRHVVLRSGDDRAGVWLKEKRDIHHDYRAYFGDEPPRADGVGIQTNSQRTSDYAEGAIRRLRLTGVTSGEGM